MKPQVESWIRAVLDLVYPGACHLCEAPLSGGHTVCDACRADLSQLLAPFCSTCGQHFDGAMAGPFDCPNCRDQSFAFEFARPALRRSDAALQLVHDLKYGRRLELARDLAELTVSAFTDPRLKEARMDEWPLVPVPLHRRRLSWRQFNQSDEIAQFLAGMLDLPFARLLRRIRSTTAQTRLSRAQRRKNLRGAFEMAGPEPSALGAAPGVVLIDDVFTTGSTAHECARVLRAGGFEKVVVVTVVRG